MICNIMNSKEALRGGGGSERQKATERAIAFGATAIAACGLGIILGHAGQSLMHDADQRFADSSHGLALIPNLEIAGAGLLDISGIALEVIAISALYPALTSGRQAVQANATK